MSHMSRGRNQVVETPVLGDAGKFKTSLGRLVHTVRLCPGGKASGMNGGQGEKKGGERRGTWAHPQNQNV